MSAQQLITEHIDLWTSTIKAKNTQGRGSSKKRELYGIKKLRELILELAVRGKLVPQDPSDEPASVLLERIAAEKAQLIKDKKIKKQKALPEITGEDKPFILPEGWAGAYLDSISDINGGFAFKSSQYIENGIRVIRISDFDEKGFKDDKVVRHQYSDLLRQYVLEENNILMAMTGGTVGKCFLVGHLREKMVVNQRVATIKISSKISPVFLSCVLQSSMAKNVIHEAKNSTNDNISMSQIKGFFIPVPALAEQHRIVAKVDELMALCDQLEQQTETSLDAHNLLVDTLLSTLTDASDAKELSDNWARFMTTDGLYAGNAGATSGSQSIFDTLITTDYAVEQLKQTILQLAVMGKLVPQNPNDEPASELLKRIAAEKEQLVKDKKIKKQKPLPEITDEEKPFELPTGWARCRLQDSIDVRDGTHDSPKNADGKSTFPLITSKNFIDGAIDFDSARRISEKDHFEISKRSLVEVDDILFSMIGGNIGNQVIVRDTQPFSVKNVALFKYYDKTATAPGFFKIYTEELAVELQLQASGGAQPFVSLGALRKLVFSLPPIEEQHRIVVKVDELMALCDQLKTQLNNAQTTQLHLSDAVVENALTS